MTTATARHSGPITPAIANQTKSYIALSEQAYSNRSNQTPVKDFTFVGDGKIMLTQNLKGDARLAQMGKIDDSGFAASVYRNDKTKEFVVAYRGTECTTQWRQNCNSPLHWTANDFKADEEARRGYLTAQYQYGSDLAKVVADLRKDPRYKDYNVVLTGHSLGGGIANYAASKNGNLATWTFNPARNPLSTRDNPNARNIYAIGDPVGDPDTYRVFGLESS